MLIGHVSELCMCSALFELYSVLEASGVHQLWVDVGKPG